MNKKHYSVMLKETIDILSPKPGKLFVDCTFGCGGHTQELLAAGATVIAIDRDPAAIERADHIKQLYPNTFSIQHLRFSQLDQINSTQKIDGVLWDFGLCTTQLVSNGGFSFYSNDKLDMGMGLNEKKAHNILNSYSQDKLAYIFENYADETRAKLYAYRIIQQRNKKPFENVEDLLNIFDLRTNERMHPATKVMQALRIEVNNELEEIEISLQKAYDLANMSKHRGARFVCISFHSGEDRIVKHKFKIWSHEKKLSEITKKPLEPTISEVEQNPASRSAKLRWCEFI